MGAELEAVRKAAPLRVETSGPPVALLAATAELVAMALYELAANATRHGAAAHPDGRLSVAWQMEEERLLLEWRETGVSLPLGAPERFGYGGEVISRVLPYRLGAETSLEFKPDGVRCAIALPPGTFTAEVLPG